MWAWRWWSTSPGGRWPNPAGGPHIQWKRRLPDHGWWASSARPYSLSLYIIILPCSSGRRRRRSGEIKEALGARPSPARRRRLPAEFRRIRIRHVPGQGAVEPEWRPVQLCSPPPRHPATLKGVSPTSRPPPKPPGLAAGGEVPRSCVRDLFALGVRRHRSSWAVAGAGGLGSAYALRRIVRLATWGRRAGSTGRGPYYNHHRLRPPWWGGSWTSPPIEPITALLFVWRRCSRGGVAVPVMAIDDAGGRPPAGVMGDFVLPRGLKAVGWLGHGGHAAAADCRHVPPTWGAEASPAPILRRRPPRSWSAYCHRRTLDARPAGSPPRSGVEGPRVVGRLGRPCSMVNSAEWPRSVPRCARPSGRPEVDRPETGPRCAQPKCARRRVSAT
jgi:hypothetical protein